MNFKVISITEKEEWNFCLSKAVIYDFYHTHLYHSLDTSGEVRLLLFEEGVEMIALPLIFREIPGTEFKDATSVYGYVGWIYSRNIFSSELFAMLEEYMHQEKVLSVFSRLHPLIPCSSHFERGKVINMNTTTGIDLTLTPENQILSYSESIRRTIKNRRKMGLHVKFAENSFDLDQFITLYYQSMNRLKAPSHYYFDRTYFEKIWKNEEFQSFILLAEWNGEIVGGAMFTVCSGIMQYHLGAVAEPYIYLSPIKLLIDEARKIANEQNCKYFHLGGGYGGSDDKLYTFKSRMTTLRYTFKTWQWIVNSKEYDSLSKNKKKSKYFPSYRDSTY